jgi:predicted GIY-YIG superfamily endonuclease
MEPRRARGGHHSGVSWAVAARHHHYVYVVLLSQDVLYEPKFKKCNPDYDPAKPCVYVGMTGLDPDTRFDKHKAGVRANRYVQKYGQRLLPELYECYNPMPYQAACEMEVELAIALREAGYGVWQA